MLVKNNFKEYALYASFLLRHVYSGKLLIQSLEWLLHNFTETHHFRDHEKQLGKSLLQHAKFIVTEHRVEFRKEF